jgi:hypothetical protein
MTHHAQILWFAGCANDEPARVMLRDVVARVAPDTTIEDVDASEAAVAERLRFPGSPTTTRRDAASTAPTPAFAACRTLGRSSGGARHDRAHRWRGTRGLAGR